MSGVRDGPIFKSLGKRLRALGEVVRELIEPQPVVRPVPVPVRTRPSRRR